MKKHKIFCKEHEDGENWRNERGRTPFVQYWIRRHSKTTVLLGEYMDSSADYESMRKINEEMKEVRRDFIMKNAASERSASKIYLSQ